jgi:hypothetical protein
MKNQFPFLILLACTITLVSCKEGAEKNTESVEEKVEQFEEKDKDLGTWLQDLAGTTPNTGEELIAKLPKELIGMSLRSTGNPSSQTIAGTYSLDEDPNNKSTSISITVVDGAGSNGFQHVNAVYKLINQKVDFKSEEGWSKTYEYKGNQLLIKEQINTEIPRSELEYIKDNRYHITLSGLRLKSDTLLEAMDDLEKTKF